MAVPPTVTIMLFFADTTSALQVSSEIDSPSPVQANPGLDLAWLLRRDAALLLRAAREHRAVGKAED
jgi:hypothetical protein